MREISVDVLVDALVTLASAIGAVGLTAVGLLVDRAGLQNLLVGSVAQGAWEVWMGTLAVFVGCYLLGYRTVWPAIAGRR